MKKVAALLIVVFFTLILVSAAAAQNTGELPVERSEAPSIFTRICAILVFALFASLWIFIRDDISYRYVLQQEIVRRAMSPIARDHRDYLYKGHQGPARDKDFRQ